ncbi:MAG: folate-binding protein YgfZ [Legionella longbeachae]|nr:folate-binding protein YgfZ [Legionella longbeachae]
MKNTSFDHLINNRSLTTFKTIEEELNLQPGKNYLFDLSYLNVIQVEGDKTIDFLQGQLTCDIRLISDIQMIQGAQCNLKGRVLALMDIINWQGVKLILPNDLIDLTINSLNKTAMLSRVSLKCNSQLRIFGFYLQNHDDILPGPSFFPNALYAQAHTAHSCYYHLGHGFYIILVQPKFANNIEELFLEKNQLLGSLTWHTLRLSHQHLNIYPESRGLFLPHRLDLQHTQYLNFNKGCYKGQEIIARMHYKATLKHQLKIFKIKSDQKIYSGQKIIKAREGIELGELIDFSVIDNDHYLIAVSILMNSDRVVLFDGHTKPLELI